MTASPILIMAGGTGGHVFPALAVARELRGRDEEVVWLGTERGLEATDFSNQSSGVLSSVSRSNALAVIPPGAVITEGGMVEVILLDHLTRD